MSKTDQTESDFGSTASQPRCEYAADGETKEIPVCSHHAERVCDFGIGFSGSDVRDLRAGERLEVDR